VSVHVRVCACMCVCVCGGGCGCGCGCVRVTEFVRVVPSWLKVVYEKDEIRGTDITNANLQVLLCVKFV